MHGKEKYFKILGIQPTADINVIKKAYRKKAFKYHPDRNNSPNAHIQFIQITDAYEILTGQQKVRRRTGPQVKPKTKEEILAEKMERARARWKQQQKEEERKDKEYYGRIAFGWKWKIFILGSIYTAIFSILLSCDYFLDGEQECLTEYEVIADYMSRSIGSKGEQFHIDTDEYWDRGYLAIRGNYSYLFHDLKSVSVMLDPLPPDNPHSHSNVMRQYTHFEGKELYNTHSYSSIYGVFPILHMVFMIPLTLVIFKRPNLRFSIWRLVSIWIIFPTITFFTFSNDRIFYLIDLILGE
jgi:hypothetical protein